MLPYTPEGKEKQENIFSRISRIKQNQETIMTKKREKKEKLIKPLKNKDKLQTGDAVLYRNILRKTKLDPKWLGSYIIEHTRDCGSCVITDPNRKQNIEVTGKI
ncbi:hypothetical protein COBT_001596 [Conglomerata obtusa]